ncbi:hypothetical protein B0T20DRAFT_394280 [Sordaria brevicollis]|uniref:Uncharacterized protein n=1 Tax=Sordaria brevicollis TaxID=83679 RepID=A0AAE0PC00_SORBR|nr:hypothetical protein B0T20DRAFT_394280 [Sordaria brevicollis]
MHESAAAAIVEEETPVLRGGLVQVHTTGRMTGQTQDGFQREQGTAVVQSGKCPGSWPSSQWDEEEKREWSGSGDLELERARGVGQSKGKEMEGGPEPGVVRTCAWLKSWVTPKAKLSKTKACARSVSNWVADGLCASSSTPPELWLPLLDLFNSIELQGQGENGAGKSIYAGRVNRLGTAALDPDTGHDPIDRRQLGSFDVVA